MRLFMRKPESLRGSDLSGKKFIKSKDYMRRTSSVNEASVPNEQKFDPVADEIKNIGNSELGDFVLPQSRFSSRRGSIDTITDYDLPYMDELEINRAFNVFDRKLNI